MTKKPLKPAAARGHAPAAALSPDLTPALPADVDDDAVVMHDEFRQIVLDSSGCHDAVRVLMCMLRSQAVDGLDAQDLRGLAMLLESVHNRLELVVAGLVATAVQLGLPDARELA